MKRSKWSAVAPLRRKYPAFLMSLLSPRLTIESLFSVCRKTFACFPNLQGHSSAPPPLPGGYFVGKYWKVRPLLSSSPAHCQTCLRQRQPSFHWIILPPLFFPPPKNQNTKQQILIMPEKPSSSRTCAESIMVEKKCQPGPFFLTFCKLLFKQEDPNHKERMVVDAVKAGC